MAIGGIIGSIRVALGLDTVQFQNGAKQMQGTLGGISKTLKSFAAGLGAALSLGAIVKVMQSAIDKADELGKTAQKIGLPVEALSKLEYGARLADVSLDQLSVGVGKLSQALADAAGGQVTDATKALAAIGVAATDSTGAIRPTEAVFLDVAEAFSKIENGAGKTALAMDIFGRSGKELIPLLNAGAAGLRESADEAERLGLVIDNKTAKAAEQFNDNLTRLKATMEGLTNKAMVALIDRFVQFSDFLVQLSQSGNTTSFFDELNARIRTTVREFQALVGVVKSLGSVWKFLTTENPEDSGAFQKMQQDIAKNFADIKTGAEAAAEASSRALGGFGGRSAPAVTETKLLAAPIIRKEDTAAIKEADKALKDLKRSADSVWEDTRTPIEQYQLKIRELNELLQQGQIDQDTYSRAVKQAQDAFSETAVAANELGQELKDTFQNQLSGVFDDLINGSFDLKNSLSDVLSQVTKIFTNNALQTLFNPTASPMQAGGGVGGFFKSLLGFAKGGTIFPGGGGGVDSQLVAFRKSPNERVDITKPGQELGSFGGDVKVNVNNYTPADVQVKQDSQGNPIVVIRDSIKGMVADGSLDSGFKSRSAISNVIPRPIIADVTFGGNTGLVQSRVQFDCWGSDFYEAKNVARALDTLLAGKKLTTAGSGATRFEGFFLEAERDGHSDVDAPDDLFRTSLDFLIWHKGV